MKRRVFLPAWTAYCKVLVLVVKAASCRERCSCRTLVTEVMLAGGTEPGGHCRQAGRTVTPPRHCSNLLLPLYQAVGNCSKPHSDMGPSVL